MVTAAALAHVNRLPVLLVPGDADDVVVPDALLAAVAGLEAAGVTVRHHTCPGLGHGLDDDGIRLGMAFLTDIFGVDLAALKAEPGDG